MATADKNPELALTSRAMDAVDCFTDGMDDLVCDLAGHFASQREPTEDGVIITEDDIEAASKVLVEAIKSADVPPEFRESVEQMAQCCAQRIRQLT